MFKIYQIWLSDEGWWNLTKHGCRPIKKPLLTHRHKLMRLQFAQTYLNWTPQTWNTVLFSDESKFQLFGSDSIQYIRCPPCTRFDSKYQIPTVKHGGGNIMVWVCFSRSGTGPIIRIRCVMDKHMYLDILQKYILPFAEEDMPLRWVYQQDNDPKHTLLLVKKWFKDNNVKLLNWPFQSPDLNPIENLWDYVDR